MHFLLDCKIALAATHKVGLLVRLELKVSKKKKLNHVEKYGDKTFVGIHGSLLDFGEGDALQNEWMKAVFTLLSLRFIKS